MRDFRKLRVWQRAHDFALSVHGALRHAPLRGAPGMVSQLVRASASVPANIAEGAGQQSRAQYARFIGMAIGSVNEAENHLQYAAGIGMIDPHTAARLITEADAIGRMLTTLRKRILAECNQDAGFQNNR